MQSATKNGKVLRPWPVIACRKRSSQALKCSESTEVGDTTASGRQATADHAGLRGLQDTDVDEGLQHCEGAVQCVRGRSQVRTKAAASNGRRKPRPTLGPKSWKCPNCLKRIDVDSARAELVRHLNARGDRCAGSGHRLPQRSTDAMDYRVAGSFEGGRRT